jgi:hypothetical protein
MNPSTVALIDEIQSAVTTFLPTAETIAAVVAGLFNPALVPVVEGIAGVVNVVVPELESAVTSVTNLSATLPPKAPSTAPVAIGKTKHGFAVSGYKRG